MGRPFAESVQWWLDLTLPKIDAPERREYLEDPARLREGEAVDPCVQRLVDYELAPPEGKGVGRGRGVIVEPLAEEISKTFNGLDAAGVAALRRPIVDSLTIGYMMLALYQANHPEPPTPELGEAPRELWGRWAVRQGTARKAFKEAGLEELDNMAWPLAANTFVADLEEQDVYTLRYKGNIRQLGIFYGRAGMLLRLFQSTTAFDLEPHKSQAKASGLWPFE